VSFLDAKGSPTITERAFVLPPSSRLGPASPDERRKVVADSPVAGHYEKAVDRESAYEKLKQGDAAATAGAPAGQPAQADGGLLGSLGGLLGGGGSSGGRSRQGVVETAMKSVVRQVGSEIGRQLVRGVLGSLMGGGRRR
jgi:hypothetical protein